MLSFMPKECVPCTCTLFWHSFDPKLQGLSLTYIEQVKKESYTWEFANLAPSPLGWLSPDVRIKVFESGVWFFAKWKVRRWLTGHQLFASSLSRLNGSVSSSMTQSFLSDRVCVYSAWDRRATKTTPIPSQAFLLSGRNRSVGSIQVFRELGREIAWKWLTHQNDFQGNVLSLILSESRLHSTLKTLASMAWLDWEIHFLFQIFI